MYYATYEDLSANEVYEFDSRERRDAWVEAAEIGEERMPVTDDDTILFLRECGDQGEDFDGNRIYYWGLAMPI